jgi:hypothetical protein
MTDPEPTDHLDLWHRLIDDASGDSFKPVLMHLDALHARLQSGLRQPLTREDHQTAEASLRAVKAAQEVMQAVHRIWSLKQPTADASPPRR